MLVVDVNNGVADSLRMLLQLSGHQVMVAHSGPTAITQAVDWCPDIVLFDISSPDFGWLRVAFRLRERPDVKQMMFAAMAGFAQDADRKRPRAAGFDQHVVNRVDPPAAIGLSPDSGAQASPYSGS